MFEKERESTFKMLNEIKIDEKSTQHRNLTKRCNTGTVRKQTLLTPAKGMGDGAEQDRTEPCHLLTHSEFFVYYPGKAQLCKPGALIRELMKGWCLCFHDVCSRIET